MKQIDLDKLPNIFVTHPGSKKVKQVITELLANPDGGSEMRFSVIMGKPGAGKTAAVRRFIDANQPYETDDGDVRPFVRVATPSDPKLRSMVSAVAKALGDENSEKGTKDVIEGRVLHYLREQKVQLLIFDEFQQLFENTAKDSVIKKTATWVKILLDQKICPILICGTSELEILLDIDEHLARRALHRTTLQPFSIDTEKQLNEFSAFLMLFQEASDIPFCDLSSADFTVRVFLATKGYIGHVSQLLQRAAARAHSKSAESVQFEHFIEVWEDNRSSKDTTHNPFTLTEEEVLDYLERQRPIRLRGQK